jgi:hypothetical protein
MTATRTDGLRWLSRAEHLALAAAGVVLVLWHADAVSWWRFALAFALIDLVGYLPGARAFRRTGGGPIAPLYHHLYNLTHNFLTAAVVVALWAAAIGGLEWAMLAIPIHLAGDRGLFGNGWKPADRPFETARVRETARMSEAAR